MPSVNDFMVYIYFQNDNFLWFSTCVHMMSGRNKSRDSNSQLKYGKFRSHDMDGK